ncbi:MAG: xanthine dehydrogenase family protein molybdopterin-binding subunit [Chloroflexota bacterium]
MSELPSTLIGSAVRPAEHKRLLLGRGAYIADLHTRGTLYAAFVRSPHAHAGIKSIDASRALALPGVARVLVGRDLADATLPLRMAPAIEGVVPTEMATMPVDKVRFVGDIVACVLAEDPYVARDARDAVQVDYAPIAAVIDPSTASASGNPLVDPAVPDNRAYYGAFEFGDPDGAFRAAHRVVTTSFSQGRQTHAPIETRGCVASWDPGEETLTFWASTQIPHPLRSALAARLRLPESKVRVITPDVGGGFGQKIPLYREDLTVAAASRLLERPVTWIEERQENLSASCHAREDRVDVEIAVAADGEILAVRAHILTDFGAYCYFPPNYMAKVIGLLIPGPYRYRHYAFDITTVLTNKAPSGPYRAPMVICAWVTEGIVDAVARDLRLDPVEVRRRNMIQPADLPHTTVTGFRYASVYPRATLEEALIAADYQAAQERREAARREGRLAGIGICTYVEPNTYGSEFYRTSGIPGSGHDTATVRIEPSGAVTCQLGVVSQGQTHRTTVAQVLASELQVPIESVAVHSGDTSAAGYGMGTRGARGGVVSAGAARGAALVLKEKLVRIAAHLLEVGAEDIEMTEGRLHVRGTPDRGLAMALVAQKAYLFPTELPPGMEPGLDASCAYDPPPLTFSSGTHVCEVEIDRETGRTHIRRYVVVEDCGTMLNPRVVNAQVHGATAQGIAGVLYEHVAYDAHGQNLSTTFQDYAMPHAAQLPPIELHHVHFPDPNTPYGMKGMSEGGTMGAVGGVANAIADALAPLGVVAVEQPFTANRLRELIRAAEPPSRHG